MCALVITFFLKRCCGRCSELNIWYLCRFTIRSSCWNSTQLGCILILYFYFTYSACGVARARRISQIISRKYSSNGATKVHQLSYRGAMKASGSHGRSLAPCCSILFLGITFLLSPTSDILIHFTASTHFRLKPHFFLFWYFTSWTVLVSGTWHSKSAQDLWCPIWKL